MGFRSNGIKWIWDDKSTTDWNDTYTTTTTTDEPIEIKAPGWKTKDTIIINSPIKGSEFEKIKEEMKNAKLTVEAAPSVKPLMHYGWVCPKCGRVNAPWVSQCGCQGSVFKKIDTWSPSGIPEACRYCSNHPSNGGSGICNCTLGTPEVTC